MQSGQKDTSPISINICGLKCSDGEQQLLKLAIRQHEREHMSNMHAQKAKMVQAPSTGVFLK
jgi:hypothetical protein